MISCGSKKQTNETPAATAPAADAREAGRCSHGRHGDRNDQARRHRAENEDHQHGRRAVLRQDSTPTPAMTEDVVTGDGGTLQNVVVYLKGDFSAVFISRRPPRPPTSIRRAASIIRTFWP